jgi:hypothetical protein
MALGCPQPFGVRRQSPPRGRRRRFDFVPQGNASLICLRNRSQPKRCRPSVATALHTTPGARMPAALWSAPAEPATRAATAL